MHGRLMTQQIGESSQIKQEDGNVDLQMVQIVRLIRVKKRILLLHHQMKSLHRYPRIDYYLMCYYYG